MGLGRAGNRKRAARRRQSANLSGVRKAAILLVAVGEELPRRCCARLPEPDVQRIPRSWPNSAALRRSSPRGARSSSYQGFFDTHHFIVHAAGLCAAVADRYLRKDQRRRPAHTDAPFAGGGAGQPGQAAAAPIRSSWATLLDSEHPQTIA